MRHVAATLTIAALASSAPLFAQQLVPSPGAKEGGRVLRLISDFSSPPFSYREAGKVKGFEIDLGQAIGKELGAKVEWIPMGFSIASFASKLDTGGADAAISSISITGDRERKLAFSRPYYRTSLAAATFKDRSWRNQEFRNGLKNDIVGVMRGTTAEQWARDNLSAKRRTYSSPDRLVQALRDSAKIMKAGSVDELLEDLYRKKRITTILLDEDILNSILSKRTYPIKIVERGVDHQDYGIAVKKGNAKLLEELDRALEKLDASGEYDALYEKWFSRRTDLPKKK
jgi:polar amino acid transport system substrate-binding protein